MLLKETLFSPINDLWYDGMMYGIMECYMVYGIVYGIMYGISTDIWYME